MSKAEWQTHRDDVLREAMVSLDTPDEARRVLRDHRSAGCKVCRARAATLRGNRNARERHEALTSLGLKRVRGSLGGVYYE